MSTMLDRRSNPFLKGATQIGSAGRIRSPAKLTIKLLLNFTKATHIQNLKEISKILI